MNHRLAFKKVNKAIIFNQNVWLKPYIEKKLNIIFKNNFFFLFFFLSGLFFTDIDNSQDSRGREGNILFHSATAC